MQDDETADASTAEAPTEPGEPAAGADEPAIGPWTPEGDALEQQQPIAPDEVDEEVTELPEDASEADALEQAMTVPMDDDYREA